MVQATWMSASQRMQLNWTRSDSLKNNLSNENRCMASLLLTVPWDFKRMDSTSSFGQVPSGGNIQNHIVFVPKWKDGNLTIGGADVHKRNNHYSPFHDGHREAIDGAEEFDRGVFIHGVWSEPDQELWPPDHRPFIHIFVQPFLLYLPREH